MRKKNQQLWNKLTNSLNDFEVKAGWFENSRYSDSTPVAFIAKIQNDGAQINITPKMRAFLHYLGIHLEKDKGQIIIPPHPFMDKAKQRAQGAQGREVLLQELLRVFEGRQTMEQAINSLGAWLQGVIQEEIANTDSPALSNATIKIREDSYSSKSKRVPRPMLIASGCGALGAKSDNIRGSKPLVSSSIMFSSLQYKVNKK